MTEAVDPVGLVKGMHGLGIRHLAWTADWSILDFRARSGRRPSPFFTITCWFERVDAAPFDFQSMVS